MIKIGSDLGVFKALAQSSTPLCVNKLSLTTGADPLLVSRIMRYLASNRLVKETNKDHYTSSKATLAMAEPRIEGAMRYFHSVSNPSFQVLPDYLQDNEYRNTTGGDVPGTRLEIHT